MARVSTSLTAVGSTEGSRASSLSGITAGSLHGILPKYRQLLNILRAQIISGQLAPDQQLPTEDELGARYGLSRGTVRKAIEQLEAERLIRTEQGIGSFVASAHPNAIPFHFGDPSAPSQAPEALITHEILEQRVLPAPIEVAERLKLPLGEPVIHVVRRRLSGGRVIGYSERYLAEAMCPALLDEDLSSGSLHERLVTLSTLPLLRSEFEIEAHVLDAGEAALLQADEGTPAIVITRMTYTAPNRPAVWYQGLFREHYSIDIRLGEPSDTAAGEAAGRAGNEDAG